MKGIILPPMFTFNVLKLSLMILFPECSSKEITWLMIKRELLGNPEVLKRKYESMWVSELEEEEIENLEK